MSVRFAVVAAMLLATPMAQAKKVSFGTVPATVGQHYVLEEAMHMELKMVVSMEGKTLKEGDVSMEGVKNLTFDVTAIDGDGNPSELRVVFTEHADHGTMMGQQSSDVKPVSGKTYLVTESAATTEEGAAPPAEEIGLAGRSWDIFHELRPHIEGAYKPGKSYDASVIHGLLPSQNDDFTDVSGTVVFQGVEQGIGVFEVVLVASGQKEANGPRIQIDIVGTASYDVTTGQLQSMNLGGPLKMEGQEGPDSPLISGTGQFGISRKVTGP